MRAALNVAAVWPSGGSGVPNWLVVSMTICRPAARPPPAPAAALHGTEMTTTLIQLAEALGAGRAGNTHHAYW
jgi:hypothetical protein